MESTIRIQGCEYKCIVSTDDYPHGKGANIVVFDVDDKAYVSAKVIVDRASAEYSRFNNMDKNDFLKEALQIYKSRVTQEQIDNTIQSGVEVLYGV